MKRSMPVLGRGLSRAWLLLALLPAVAGCPNDHVFRLFPSCGTKEATVDQAIEPTKETDILIVVDNSGSMAEEQTNLKENFFRAECPIQDLSNIPAEYLNPTPEFVDAELAPYCGFIQILAAYEVDWRLGVITTDMSLCDNVYNSPGFGNRPQRGCLQAPDEDWSAQRKFLQQGDDDVGGRFSSILDNIGIKGNAFERGLDAMEHFLSANQDRHPDCDGHAEGFLRDSAKLIVIFLTDEDDCSYDDPSEFPDPALFDKCGDEITNEEGQSLVGVYDICYRDQSKLSDPVGHASFLKGLKGEGREDDVSVALIAGATFSGPNASAVAAGCQKDTDGAPVGQCTAPWGLSNVAPEYAACDSIVNDVPGKPCCNSQWLSERGLPECCQADPGNRYFEFARQFGGNALTDSICYESFRQTMVDIAKFAAALDFVYLPAPPVVPAAIQVELRFDGPCSSDELREPADDPETPICRVPRIPDDDSPAGRDGWQLQGTRVQFYGSWIPSPARRFACARSPPRTPAMCRDVRHSRPRTGASSRARLLYRRQTGAPLRPMLGRRGRAPRKRGSEVVAMALSNRVLSVGMVTGLLAGLTACPNDHVFRLFPSCATKEAAVDVPIEPSKATDILVVVDNSGSMLEEQQNLAENFFDPDCPITDLANIPEQYLNPTPDVVQNDLAPNCGFIQILAAYDVDWRVGVITTDVSQCDNDFGSGGAGWGRRPQRGCLQVPPNETWNDDLGRNYIARGDDDVGNRFTNILNGIQTHGNNIERGLDAVEMFLTGSPSPAPTCENHASSFIRDDARLVVMFLSDENDCSHAVTNVSNDPGDIDAISDAILDGAFPDESLGEDCVDGDTDIPTWYTAFGTNFIDEIQALNNLGNDRETIGAGALCYLDSHADQLTDVSHYVDVLRGEKGDDVAVAIIAGANFEGGGVTAGGCRQAGDGQPQGGCWEPWGLSNSAAACNNGISPTGQPCCQADSGTRYYQLAQQLGAGDALTDSICYASFRQTMVDIASFAARVGFVQLPESPLSPAAVQVELVFDEPCPFENLREPEDDPTTNVCRVPRIPDDVADPTSGSGWQLQGDTVRFYGEWVPQPRQEIRVRSLAASNTDVPGCTTFETAADGGN